MILGALLGPASIVVIVFLAAGTFAYWQGTTYCALTLVGFAATFLFLRNSKELLYERVKPGKGVKSWDRILVRVMIALILATIFLASLDGGRYGWSPNLPIPVYVAAAVFYGAGFVIVLWAMTVNRFFSSVVRIQKDRGHTVVQNGPYRHVRHPGYLGALLYIIATPMLLGSLWALSAAAAAVAATIVRTALEDKTLTAELEGYREYKEKVKYRISPYVW